MSLISALGAAASSAQMVQAAKRIAILFIFLRRYYPYQVLGYVLSSTRRHRGSAHRAPLLFSGCKDIFFFFAVQDCEGLLPILLAFTEYVRSCRSCLLLPNLLVLADPAANAILLCKSPRAGYH